MNSKILDGAILVDKPAGITSAKVVSRIKHHFGLKKVGHSGTLDPMATGLLVVLVGKATRLQSLFLESAKSYSGIILFGQSTSTDDVEGEVLERDESLGRLATENLAELAAELEREFAGRQQQVPPDVSAIKVDGKRSYSRARAGEELNLAAREITVHSIALEFNNERELRYSIACSKGSYIRSFARDFGRHCQTLACLKSISRESSEPFSIEDALTLEAICQKTELSEVLIPMAELVNGLPKLELSDGECRQLFLGDQTPLASHHPEASQQSLAAVFDPQGSFRGLLEEQGSSWKLRFVLPPEGLV